LIPQLHISNTHLQPHPTLFLFTAPATTYIYTLSLHDALPIFRPDELADVHPSVIVIVPPEGGTAEAHAVYAGLLTDIGECTVPIDRKSTRLNSSHLGISYAVFCLKKKKRHTYPNPYSRTNSRN